MVYAAIAIGASALNVAGVVLTAAGFIRAGRDALLAGFTGLLWPILPLAYVTGVAGLWLMTAIGKAGKYVERKLP